VRAAVVVVVLLALASPSHAQGFLFVRSDFNADASTDVSDAVALLLHLFREPLVSACLDAGDSNDDGSLDISDAIHTLQYLFLGGPPPAPPFPRCGPDETLDALDCAASPHCPPVRNEVVAVRRINSGIEIELYSDMPFPARALFPVLCIGMEGFVLSRPPDDGDFHTIIFLLSEEEFARLRQGDPVTIQYGGCREDTSDLRPFWDLWVFGPFDRTLLEG
jgi:hypothetical protein